MDKFKFIFDPEVKARNFNLIATPIVVVSDTPRGAGSDGGGEGGGGGVAPSNNIGGGSGGEIHMNGHDSHVRSIIIFICFLNLSFSYAELFCHVNFFPVLF
jgi:hypothetical protein